MSRALSSPRRWDLAYEECSSKSSEGSVKDTFYVATVASLGSGHRQGIAGV